MAEIRGVCRPEFEDVRTAFAANFDERGEVGAGVCVWHRGEPVVDLTGGVADDTGRPYDDSTLQMVFSSTKGATALCLLRLVEAGAVDVAAPVATYWPEFAAAGKDAVTVAQLLSHQAGLVDVDGSMTLDEALQWSVVCGRLAASEPLWDLGSGHGYHAMTFGWLVGEVVRRVDGRSLGQFLHDEISTPLGLDLWVGLPDAELPRVAPILPFDPPEGLGGFGAVGDGDSTGDGAPRMASLTDLLEQLFGAGNLLGRALGAPGAAFAPAEVWADPRVLGVELPAANGVTNAKSLAKMYAATIADVDGFRIIGADMLSQAMQPQTSGPDKVLMFPMEFGLGFMRNTAFSPFGSDSGFGHYGAGGSVGFADPGRELAFGYVMNKMQIGIAGDPRTAALIAAVNSSLA